MTFEATKNTPFDATIAGLSCLGSLSAATTRLAAVPRSVRREIEGAWRVHLRQRRSDAPHQAHPDARPAVRRRLPARAHSPAAPLAGNPEADADRREERRQRQRQDEGRERVPRPRGPALADARDQAPRRFRPAVARDPADGAEAIGVALAEGRQPVDDGAPEREDEEEDGDGLADGNLPRGCWRAALARRRGGRRPAIDPGFAPLLTGKLNET
jgi:hypothetical protein